jgi:hypothetical protein
VTDRDGREISRIDGFDCETKVGGVCLCEDCEDKAVCALRPGGGLSMNAVGYCEHHVYTRNARSSRHSWPDTPLGDRAKIVFTKTILASEPG